MRVFFHQATVFVLIAITCAPIASAREGVWTPDVQRATPTRIGHVLTVLVEGSNLRQGSTLLITLSSPPCVGDSVLLSSSSLEMSVLRCFLRDGTIAGSVATVDDAASKKSLFIFPIPDDASKNVASSPPPDILWSNSPMTHSADDVPVTFIDRDDLIMEETRPFDMPAVVNKTVATIDTIAPPLIASDPAPDRVPLPLRPETTQDPAPTAMPPDVYRDHIMQKNDVVPGATDAVVASVRRDERADAGKDDVPEQVHARPIIAKPLRAASAMQKKGTLFDRVNAALFPKKTCTRSRLIFWKRACAPKIAPH